MLSLSLSLNFTFHYCSLYIIESGGHHSFIAHLFPYKLLRILPNNHVLLTHKLRAHTLRALNIKPRPTAPDHHFADLT